MNSFTLNSDEQLSHVPTVFIFVSQTHLQGKSTRPSKTRQDAYQKVRGIKDEAEKKTAMEKWFAEDLKNWVALAEKSLPAGPGPFLVGGKLSLADILFYTLLLAPGGFFDDTEGAKARTGRSHHPFLIHQK